MLRVFSGRHQAASYDYSSYFLLMAAISITNIPNMMNTGSVLPGIGGAKTSAVKNPARTVLAGEAADVLPYSWHQPAIAGRQCPIL